MPVTEWLGTEPCEAQLAGMVIDDDRSMRILREPHRCVSSFALPIEHAPAAKVDDRTSQLQACGTFRDVLSDSNGALRFVEHNVIVDAETLPANMVDLF